MKILTYGEAMIMFVAEAAGPLENADRFIKRIAGADLNVAIGLSRLGHDVTYLSRVGDDSFGRTINAAIAAEGIDTSRIVSDPRYPTGFQLKSRAERGEDPAVEYFRRGSAASHLSRDDFDPSLADTNAHLHLTGVAPAISASSCELALALADAFRQRGRTISFDPNLRPTLWPSREIMVDTLNRLASYADWVLPGIGEGEILTGCDTPEGVAEFYLSRGARGVFVKLGAAGAYWADAKGAAGRVAATPVREVVDTVGAGDGFAVGVISALLAGADATAASRRGALIGALAVQVIGDSEGLPTADALAALEDSGAAPSASTSRASAA
ncbi:sugar kinase [Chitinasiproducens palmae]|uniref:2-dehydro-3-deoxygluconokinase n=1 Tax=Chitinasiproducens palmae TaxID=1770053 RepID=A0A1H2PJB7_9BURK|nr:sugar kinase [Chitinasiproducens palmae]SDV46410.1 2-dehydro-3-deoxygluconokinase [Chitinasiproducens palmae]